MELIELTGENISQYIESCLETQYFILKNDATVNREQMIKTAEAESSYFIGIVDEGRVVGMGVVNKIVHPQRTNGYIDNIVVHESYRGQGLFSLIMNTLEAKTLEWGGEGTKLTCSRSHVQPLYERRGYYQKPTRYYVKDLNQAD